MDSENFKLLSLPVLSLPGEHVVAWHDGAPFHAWQFRQRALAWCDLLAAHSGGRYALHTADSMEFAAILFGAWLAQKTILLPGDALPVSCRALAGEVDAFLGDFEAVWAPLQLHEFEEAKHTSVLPAQDQITAATTGDVSGHARLLDGDFIGLIVHTSGSSGAAKAIPKKLSQLAAEVDALDAMFGARIGDAAVLATVSHQHIYGLLFKVLWPLTTGRAVHVRSVVFAQECLPALQAHPCVLVSSPAHLKRFPSGSSAFATPPRAVFSSGGPLLRETAEASADLFGSAPIEIYGSSETGGIAWRQRAFGAASCSGETADAAGHADEQWQPLPRVDVRIDAAQQTLDVRSPYLPDDAWLRMADRAEPAVNGCFLLHGRVDRIVKLEEKRISLDAIERLLVDSALSDQARVVLTETSSRRQRIAAVVVLNDAGKSLLRASGKAAVNAALRDLLTDAIEPVALPRSWRYPDAMPVDAQGKTTQALLLELLTPVTPATPAGPFVAKAAVHPPVHILLERDAQHVLLQLQIDGGLAYFNGHFPGAPILPGVVQIDWAIACGRQYFDLPEKFTGMHALKFQRVIEPGASVLLELRFDAAKSSLSFNMHAPQWRHASGRILFGSAS